MRFNFKPSDFTKVHLTWLCLKSNFCFPNTKWFQKLDTQLRSLQALGSVGFIGISSSSTRLGVLSDMREIGHTCSGSFLCNFLFSEKYKHICSQAKRGWNRVKLLPLFSWNSPTGQVTQLILGHRKMKERERLTCYVSWVPPIENENQEKKCSFQQRL